MGYMNSGASIELEFLPGTTIEDAVTEAKVKAQDFDVVYVKFNFNGVSMSVGRNADVEQAVKDFHAELNSPKFKFVVAN